MNGRSCRSSYRVPLIQDMNLILLWREPSGRYLRIVFLLPAESNGYERDDNDHGADRPLPRLFLPLARFIYIFLLFILLLFPNIATVVAYLIFQLAELTFRYIVLQARKLFRKRKGLCETVVKESRNIHESTDIFSSIFKNIRSKQACNRRWCIEYRSRQYIYRWMRIQKNELVFTGRRYINIQ